MMEDKFHTKTHFIHFLLFYIIYYIVFHVSISSNHTFVSMKLSFSRCLMVPCWSVRKLAQTGKRPPTPDL